MTISQHELRFIIPGWAFGPESVRPLAGKLGGEILTLPSLSSRGAGPGHDRGISPWARGLLAGIPAAAPRVTLIGWSLGAMIALESAMAGPDRAWRLVLLAGSARFVADAGNDPGVPERNLRAMMAGLRRSREATIQRFRQECCRPAVMNDAVRARIDLESNGWSDGELRAGLEYLMNADLRPGLSAMNAPVLLIHGSEDAVIPLAAGEALASVLPRAALHPVPGAGHALPILDPDRVAGAALPFLGLT